ncbi:hypothetical protein [Nocardia sp. NPDC057668]|uniref:hypothetical protein n=1 Tax=Nocardia sp. NPDC057668 TaxID=3346202 RepID=UPI00367100A7
MSQDTDPKRPGAGESESVASAGAAPEAAPVNLGKPAAEPAAAPAPAAKTVQLKLSTLGLAAAAVVLIGALFTTTALWLSARHDLASNEAAANDARHAEQVATDYAVGASNIDFTDLNAWNGRLKANTSPALAAKFDATAPKLQEILVPLKWTSSATPVAAKVATHDNGRYQVNVFLNVTSTNAQNPDGVQTTVTYNVTIDPSQNWNITDVGGNLALPKQ